MHSYAYLIALAGALAGCAPRVGTAPRISVTAEPAAGAAWRDAATADDAALLDSLPRLWTAALAAVQPSARAALAAEGALLDPGAALDHPALPPGSYSCRVVRLERRRVQGFPAQFCYVGGEADGRLSFNKQTGSDLPNGWLFADDDPTRYIFLGAQRRRPSDNSLAYRDDSARDVAGVIERVGPFRWRLVVPRREPGVLWVYELTPVPAAQQPG